MAVSGSLKTIVHLTETGSNDLGTPSILYDITKTFDFTSGTGANQINKVWADERTLTASATEELDLAGVLTDAFGAVITFATIKGIILIADASNTNDVVIGNAAATQFVGPFGAATHTIAVKPGGLFMDVLGGTGWSVSGGSTDKLKLANSAGGTSVVFKIIIFGTV
jgi:hypothetical protein